MGNPTHAPLQWRADADAPAWDSALAALGGHALQSALWGDARKAVDGIADRRWMALRAGEPVFMARIEERRLPGLGWIGWTPRGPSGAHAGELSDALAAQLAQSGMRLLVGDPWQAVRGDIATGAIAPRTIWIDLTGGREAVSRKLDKQWRYGVGRAQRMGVTVDTSPSDQDLADFFALCRSISERKRFDLSGSSALMRHLLAMPNAAAEARLFLARYRGRIGAGAFVIRCGRSLHFVWGGTDRGAADARVGEAVQWAAIEWGLAQGCTRYDLEGIDPVGNPGTYAFKKKMGGAEVTLCGKQYHPVGVGGRALAWLDRQRDRAKKARRGSACAS